MSINGGKKLCANECLLRIYQEELASVIIDEFKDGTEICDAYLALVHSEILRLDISVSTVSEVNLSNTLKHLNCNICQNIF